MRFNSEGLRRRLYCTLVSGALFTITTCGPRPAVVPPANAALPREVSLDGALASITREALERDLAAVARPRHHRASPEGLRAVRSYVAEQLSAAGLRVRFQAVAHDDTEADNVIGERRGRSDRVIVVGAHYDAVEGTDGADDNATGVAAMLAVARATRPLPLDATLRCVAFAFEEQGLVGSRAYVAALPDDERRRVRAALIVDALGYADARPGSQRFPEGLPQLVRRALPDRGDFVGVTTTASLRPLLRAAQGYVPGLRLYALPQGLADVVPDLLRSDHAAFWAAGIPAALASDTAEMRSPHYHQPSDSRATLDLEFTLRAARWVTAATVLAAREGDLPREP